MYENYMAELTLQVTVREKTNSKTIERARKEGAIPAVMYGHGIEPQMFWAQYIDFSKLYKRAGSSSIINLTVEKGKSISAIIHDVQLDPLSARFSHVDLFQVRMDEKLETHVPLEFIGEAPAIREHGGILVKPMEELHISCLPKDLPHSIAVDISTLKTFDDHIQVKDLKVPAGVDVLAEEDAAVVLVEAPRTAAQMEALDEKVDVDVTKVEGVVKEEIATAEDKKEKK